MEPAPANILERHTFGYRRRSFVKVHGHFQTVPNCFADPMRERGALVERSAFQRDEGHHIGRSHSRMYTRVPAQIDSLDRCRDTPQRAFGHRFRRARERNHRTIMIRVHLGAKQQHAWNQRDRLLDGLHDRRVAPFGEIGDALDQ